MSLDLKVMHLKVILQMIDNVPHWSGYLISVIDKNIYRIFLKASNQNLQIKTLVDIERPNSYANESL